MRCSSMHTHANMYSIVWIRTELTCQWTKVNMSLILKFLCKSFRAQLTSKTHLISKRYLKNISIRHYNFKNGVHWLRTMLKSKCSNFRFFWSVDKLQRRKLLIFHALLFWFSKLRWILQTPPRGVVCQQQENPTRTESPKCLLEHYLWRSR